MKILKRSSIVLISLATLLFVFSSCTSHSGTKVLSKFLKDFKNRKIEESYNYLVDNEEKNAFVEYINTLTDKNKDLDEFEKVNKAIANKLFDFDYDIIESKNIDRKNIEVKLNYKYYDFSQVYELALNDFLNKALDFDNLDGFYTKESITALLLDHINKVKKHEEQIVVKLVKDKEFKILMDSKLAELITGNSIKIINKVKNNMLS